MNRVAFITGTGKGIGRAIAELLLVENYIVFGYSRTNKIKHPNFNFIKIDLSDLKKVEKLTFPKVSNSEVVLINNAATIGKIIPLSLKKNIDIIHDYNLNIVSPTILCAKFIKAFSSNKKIIINISSGAANNSIASWSIYCAAKAAIDRLTNVLIEEKHPNLTIFSVHPGIVNTQMQVRIRESDSSLFPSLKKFIDYYNNNKLENVEIVAQKLFYIIRNHKKFDQNIVSIRDVYIN